MSAIGLDPRHREPIGHSIKTFGLRLGHVGRGEFEGPVRELVADNPLIAGLTDVCCGPGLELWQEYIRLHKVVVAIVRQDELCRRFMRRQGVGSISALAFRTAIDDPRGSVTRRWAEPISD